MIWDTRPVRSVGFMGTWEASAVVSMVATRRLVMGSTLERRAWGITTFFRILPKDMPRARAASICPILTVFIPAIRYSEQNAAGSRDVAVSTQT